MEVLEERIKNLFRSKYGWQCIEDVAQNVFHISCEDKSIDKS